MSSSTGTPSNKMGWYKSMCAKIKHEGRLYEAAAKLIEGGKTNVVLPMDKGGKQKKANLVKLEAFKEQAKLEKTRKQDRENKKLQQKKEESEA